MIYFEDVDAVVERAVAGGAKVLQPLQDQFYGDRSCKLEDPFGHAWMFSTHKEDVPPEELKRRADAMFAADGDVIQVGRTAGTTVETGTPFDIAEVHRWTVRDGRAVAAHFSIDTPAMLAALSEPRTAIE